MGWRDWVPISKSGSRKLDLAFSRESRMKVPSARPWRNNSSVFHGKKCDEYVWHFLSMECKEKGCVTGQRRSEFTMGEWIFVSIGKCPRDVLGLG